LGPIPNPQSPIPNPQSPFYVYLKDIILHIYDIILNKRIIYKAFNFYIIENYSIFII